eukprot:Amastigsp_a841279_504.p1 type:complete len:613 gc:universal Amastigsp_a841279_504:50-1888(+)
MAAEPSPMLFSRETQAIVYNYKPEPVQRMLDFDHMCRRAIPSIAALVAPGAEAGNHKVFFGTKEIMIPVFGSIEDAVAQHPGADVFLNFASQRSAYPSSSLALDQASIRTVVIIAEGVPEKDTRKLIAKATRVGKTIIGPATVGGVQAGAFKIGDTAGTSENIVACKLYRPGSVGFVSKSGGLSNECYSILSRVTDGLFEGIAIGGDAYAGSTFADHIARYERIPEIKLIVLLGELGGTAEHEVAEMLRSGRVTKPVVAWVSGTCATMFKTEVQFGHAGAKSGSEHTSAAAKNAALRAAGAHVPESFEGFEALIGSVYRRLVDAGVVASYKDEPDVPVIPQNYSQSAKEGRVRRATGIVSTICDDRGEEPTYAGVPMSTLIESGRGIGDVISLLWFKRELPPWASKFIEMVIVLTADHGPCVSGAHNTIVAARAGKDLVSCVASGLLTIGPRFGGAIDGAARHFQAAVSSGQSPQEFVDSMKARGLLIPGIGHRIKSADNKDQRVVLMQRYVLAHMPSHRHLEFGLAVEQITLQKAANLVLNVDGCIACAFLDLFESCAAFTAEEARDMVEIGYLNGLFVLARTIGLVGHALDQQRLKQPLYRHPWDDVMYC